MLPGVCYAYGLGTMKEKQSGYSSPWIVRVKKKTVIAVVKKFSCANRDSEKTTRRHTTQWCTCRALDSCSLTTRDPFEKNGFFVKFML